MKPYRFSRRSFIAGTGAAVGLHTLLGNAEAHAQGIAARPKRLLVTHHPCGTMRYAWTPTGSGTTYTTSRLLKPFEDAGLRGDMIIVDGLNLNAVFTGPGGGEEGGTVAMMTGTPVKGTRSGQRETDDSMAAGPSFDQLLPVLRPDVARVVGPLYGLCDERVDFGEVAPRCMSYSTATRPQTAAFWQAAGETPYEHVPIRPFLKPFDMYVLAFSSLIPGGTTGGNLDALAKARIAKKSVLDLSLRELARLRTLAPASQRSLLDAHEAAIRALEQKLDAIRSVAACTLPPAPPRDLVAPIDDGQSHLSIAVPLSAAAVATPDDPHHALLGEAFMAVLRGAFQCDLTRIGILQWSPGTNHVAFGGLYPGQPELNLQHHPVLQLIASAAQIVPTNPNAEFGVAVETWYNLRLAAFLQMLKTTPDLADPGGGNLLDNTVVPYLTEVADITRIANRMPLTLFGGKNMGFQGGQYLDFAGRSYNDLWLTILQAFGVTLSDLQNVTINGQVGATMLRAPYSGVLPGVLA